ncbi:hypothetical protein B0H19DRAFT_1230425 [Mycena capillaripes]|nr:hypothetical protein B0H19DRAFT_1230425 [Mycena capillaripes]
MPAVDKENQSPPGTAVFTVGGKPAKSSSPRAVWNTATVQNLLDTLKQQKADGNQTDNASWKLEAFNAASINLAGTERGPNGSGGPPKTARMCSTRWVAEKAEYLIFRAFRAMSGWGWNAEKHTIEVEDNVWAEYVEKNPKLKKYRFKAYPFYDDMADLVDGGFATGDNAFIPGQNDEDPGFPLDPALRGEGGIHRLDIPDSPGTPIPWDPSDDDEPEVIEVPKNTKKRTRAISDSPPSSASTGKHRRGDGHGRKPSAGHAMLAVSEGLKEVANALARDPGGPSSPERKAKATAAIMQMTQVEDEAMKLGEEDAIRVLQLIRADTSVADVFLAIPEVHSMRKAFLLAELQANTV